MSGTVLHNPQRLPQLFLWQLVGGSSDGCTIRRWIGIRRMCQPERPLRPARLWWRCSLKVCPMPPPTRLLRGKCTCEVASQHPHLILSPPLSKKTIHAGSNLAWSFAWHEGLNCCWKAHTHMLRELFSASDDEMGASIQWWVW